MLRDWNYRTPNTDFFESRREQVHVQEELSMKGKVLRDTKIRSMHELGEMKESTRTTR